MLDFELVDIRGGVEITVFIRQDRHSMTSVMRQRDDTLPFQIFYKG